MVNINLILENVFEKITPDKEEAAEIKKNLNSFIKKFEEQKKKLKINAEIFVGGSFAKGTVIKKNNYDLDIFIRFYDNKLSDTEISNLTEKILKTFIRDFKRIHGSRDYFMIKIGKNVYLELIPVIKVRNPKESKNITDLSYSHVNYVKKKVKNNMLKEIMLAKAFCHASRCYGAESYIQGFSGYSLELLIYYYKGFMKFIKETAKNNEKTKIIIDIEKFYKNKNEIMINLNSSKLQSPIILVDPTFKQRNVTAALSEETFEIFKEHCRNFLKKPNEEFFEVKKIDIEKFKKTASSKKLEFIMLKITTNKQEGDIAGSKLLKFYNHLNYDIIRFFEIKDKEFIYKEEKSAEILLSVKKRKELIYNGPFTNQKEAVKQFKKAHKKTFIKKDRIYAKEKINFTIKEFIKDWKKKNEKRISEMSILELEILN